ncbi:MAG: hypothetical protein ACYTGJ_12880 [Planctomycetota bacterium]|jgi:hypothetical protein
MTEPRVSGRQIPTENITALLDRHEPIQVTDLSVSGLGGIGAEEIEPGTQHRLTLLVGGKPVEGLPVLPPEITSADKA